MYAYSMKKISIWIILSIVFSVIIGLLILSNLLYPSIYPMIKNGQTILFADWSGIMVSIECHNRGFDVYLNNPCDHWGREMVYGKILLYLPLVEKFTIFYYLILPLTLNFVFIFIIVSFFNYKNKYEYLAIGFLLLNFPTLLAIERANFDILIFISFYLLSISNKSYINHIIVCLSSLIKFYPITSLSIFLFDRKINRSFMNILLSISIISFILFFQKDELIQIFNTRELFSGHGMYSFSMKELFLTLFIFIEYGVINNIYLYFLVCFIILLPIIIIIYKNYKRIKIIEKYNYYKNFSLNDYQDRMFVVFSITVVSCYLFFYNFSYREIFFIGLVPYILKQIKDNINKEYFNFFLNFILAKLFLSTVLTIIYMEKLFPDYNVAFLLSKHFLDLALITIVSINLLCIFHSFYVKKSFN